MTIAATAIDPAYERIPRLDAYGKGDALLAIDRQARRVVANTKFFSNLSRVDATRIKTKHTLGTVKDVTLYADPKRFATFLIVSDLIHTYAHVGSTLNIVAEKDTPALYRAEIDGHHEYFTNSRHEERVHFAIEIEKKTGVVTVSSL